MTQKHLLITGCSNISWDDAINQAILETSKTIDNITDIVILKKYGNISNDKIISYIVDLDLSFTINKNR